MENIHVQSSKACEIFPCAFIFPRHKDGRVITSLTGSGKEDGRDVGNSPIFSFSTLNPRLTRKLILASRDLQL